jgi:hypothetical protein
VKVLVGEGDSQKEFNVHEGILCDRSDFFKKALNGPWLESTEKTVKLPEDDPKTFRLYQGLLYTNEFPPNCAFEDEDLQTDDTIGKVYNSLGKLYVLCEKLLDRVSQKMAFDRITRQGEISTEDGMLQFPGPTCINIIYEGTMEGDEARVMVVNMYTKHGQSAWLPKDEEDCYPKTFLYDLCRSTLAKLECSRSV